MSATDPLVAHLLIEARKAMFDVGPGPVVTSAAARLSAVLAAARDVVDAYRAIEACAVPYASCPGHANEAGVRDDGRHDACEACRANDRTDADLDVAERVLVGCELNLSNAFADAGSAA